MLRRESLFKNFLIYILSLLSLANCSHQLVTSERTPATEISESELLETQFWKILRSKTTEQLRLRLQIRFNEIEELYFRAYSYRNKFDSDLQNATQNNELTLDSFHQSMIDSGTYPHLMILKEKWNQRINEMINLIERLLEVISDPSDTKYTQNEQVYARKAIDYISTYYRFLPFQFLIAHYSIALGLEEKRITDFNLSSTLDRILTQYTNVSIRKKIDENIKIIDNKTTFLSKKINDQAEALQKELKSINFSNQKIDSFDWLDHDSKTIVTRVLNQIQLTRKSGGTILFHDYHRQSAEAARQIMEFLSTKSNLQPEKFKFFNSRENSRENR